jgi:hypothetical protein
MSTRVLCSFTLLLLLACPAVAPETRYVSKTGSNTPPYATPETAAATIQVAVVLSNPGDRVLLAPGEYEESVTLTREGISLVGAGSDSSRIIVPPGEAVGVLAEGRSADFYDLAVVGGDIGISLADADLSLIADCRVEAARESCLGVSGWTDLLVIDTVLSGAPEGIHVRGADYYSYGEPELFISGSTFDGTEVGIRVHGRSGVIAAGCAFLRNKEGIILGFLGEGASALIHACAFLEGQHGIFSMTPSGVIDVSSCVFALNAGAGMATDQTGLVTDSLFYANGTAARGYDGTPKLAFDRCSFVSNLAALEVAPLLATDCVFWNNARDLPPVRPETVVIRHSLINDLGFAGENGNISGDPRFVGWGTFDDSDNPLHVDGSAAPRGDGSAERPFRSVQQALLTFDFRLAADSRCIAAGAFGGNIGYPAGVAPLGAPRSDTVVIEMQPGTYEMRSLVIPPHLTVRRAPGASGRPSPRGEVVLALQDTRLLGLALESRSVEAYGAELVDCELHSTDLSLYGASALRCKVLAARTSLAYAPSTMANCLLVGKAGWPTLSLSPADKPHELRNCTIVQGDAALRLYPGGTSADLTNCIVAGPLIDTPELLTAHHCLFPEPWPGEGNVTGDARFVDAENGDFRLMPDSPCIDAGFNDPELPETDIAGMHRIMFGGKSLTVDMGAYEFYINELTTGPNPDQTTFTWSSLADKTYSIFYTDDLLTWHLAVPSFPSSGNQTTSWLDDGTLTGLPPSLSRIRFYRLLENP